MGGSSHFLGLALVVLCLTVVLGCGDDTGGPERSLDGSGYETAATATATTRGEGGRDETENLLDDVEQEFEELLELLALALQYFQGSVSTLDEDLEQQVEELRRQVDEAERRIDAARDSSRDDWAELESNLEELLESARELLQNVLRELLSSS